MGDNVTYIGDGYWDIRKGVIVGFLTIDGQPFAVIRTKDGTYITKPLDELRYTES